MKSGKACVQKHRKGDACMGGLFPVRKSPSDHWKDSDFLKKLNTGHGKASLAKITHKKAHIILLSPFSSVKFSTFFIFAV